MCRRNGTRSQCDSLTSRSRRCSLSPSCRRPPPSRSISRRTCSSPIPHSTNPQCRRPSTKILQPSPSQSSDPERASLLPRKTPTSEPKDEDEDEKGLTAFLLKFGEGLEETTDSRLFISAITIGLSYFLGGLVPLLPYFFISTAGEGLVWSAAITAVVLLVFGIFKTFFTGAAIGWKGYTYGAVSTLLVGGAAAAASFGVIRALEGQNKEDGH